MGCVKVRVALSSPRGELSSLSFGSKMMILHVLPPLLSGVGLLNLLVTCNLRDMLIYLFQRPLSKQLTSWELVNRRSKILIVLESGASGTETFVMAPRRM